MKTKQLFWRLKTKLSLISLIACVGLSVWSCKEDDDLSSMAPDTRLEGKDKIAVLHVNPKTGNDYTSDEIAALGYDPGVEEYYSSNQRIELFFWAQQKPEKIEVTNDESGEIVGKYSNFVRDDRPEVASYKDGYGYSAKWKIKMKDTDIPVDGSVTLNIKVTYFDVGIDGFTTPSVRETKFTLYHYYVPPPAPTTFFIGGIAKNLVGYWQFDDADNLGKATIGNNLELHGSEAAVAGVTGSDGATFIETGSGYSIDHGLPASGGDKVNTYTIIYDVKAPAVDTYVNLMQNNPNNSVDGTLYIKPNAGFWLNGLSDSEGNLVQANTWHRIVTTLDGATQTFKIYVDGVLVHTVNDVAADSYFAPETSNFYVFSDDNGEDGPINCSSLMLFDSAFSDDQVTALPSINEPVLVDYSEVVAGRWKFDDADNLGKATIGNNLELHGTETAVAGVSGDDGASFVETGSGYLVDHGLPASGGDKVNTYTIIYDVKAPAVDTYVNLMQNNPNNSVDGTLYIKPNAGFWLNGLSDSEGNLVQGNTWHRIVTTLDGATQTFKIYVDGELVHMVNDVASDSYFAPETSNFYVFSDDNGEDGPINCSDLVMLGTVLNPSVIASISDVNVPIN